MTKRPANVRGRAMVGRTGQGLGMEALRYWSVRHSRGLKRVYDVCARGARILRPVAGAIGERRMERLLTPVERAAKGFLFDCRMCGQ